MMTVMHGLLHGLMQLWGTLGSHCGRDRCKPGSTCWVHDLHGCCRCSSTDLMATPLMLFIKGSLQSLYCTLNGNVVRLIAQAQQTPLDIVIRRDEGHPLRLVALELKQLLFFNTIVRVHP
jgi:hypothetical protein